MAKEIKDNKEQLNNEEVKEQETKESKKVNRFGGIDVTSLPDPEEDPIEEMPATMRTLKMAAPYINEIYKSIFMPLGLTEENGLVRIDPTDNNSDLTLCWDTVNLSEEDDEDLFIKETNYKASLIEALLYGRYCDGLMPGAKDINDDKYRVLGGENPIIMQSFELVVDYNKKDVEEAINLIKDATKIPPAEYGQIFVSPRPASPDTSGFNRPKCSIIIINRSDEEMDSLGTAYRTERFGKKVNKAINKSSQTVYGTAKMVGQKIMIPGAEVLGMTAGTLGGAAAQSVGVALSEGANEFRKSFNINAIKERTSTQELIQAFTKGRKKATRGGAF